jgi:hypothetical protein
VFPCPANEVIVTSPSFVQFRFQPALENPGEHFTL